MTIFQLRGGNSGYSINGIPYSNTQQACLRIILLRHHKIEPSIDETSKKVFEVGFLNERLHITPNKEADFKVAVPLTENTTFCGSVDFMTNEGPEEHKSVTSLNTYEEVFTNSFYKMDNLAQLANYMVATKSPKGKLIYTSFIKAINYSDIKKYSWEEIQEKISSTYNKDFPPEVKVFNVNLDREGRFYVDGKAQNLYIRYIKEFWSLAAEVVENNIVYPTRPKTTKQGSPCLFCPFKKACKQWETSPTTTEDFLDLAKTCISP